ncbi:hypothetical protein AMD27_09260 [Acinetobacter sp. TGL-Y2]|nr:hypothetical protein AMD27_09260 [Acinetobacter sp. TGL-Y2]
MTMLGISDEFHYFEIFVTIFKFNSFGLNAIYHPVLMILKYLSLILLSFRLFSHFKKQKNKMAIIMTKTIDYRI